MIVKGFVPCLLLYCEHLQQWRVADQYNTNAPIVTRPKWRFVDRVALDISSIGLGVANIIARYAVGTPSSTYICPSSSYINMLVPFIEALNVALWCLLLRTMTNIVASHDRWRPNRREMPFVQSVGYVFFVGCEALSYNTLI